MEKEIWLPVVGCETHKVSSMGRIIGPRGLVRGCVKRSKTGRAVAVLVSLSRQFQSKRLHRLVLEAFVGPCPEGMEGCHNDGDATNNVANNLRWDTYEANREDMRRHGTMVAPPVRWGEQHHNASLSDAQVEEIRSAGVRVGEYSATAKRYGVSHQTIRRIVSGLTRRRAAEAAMYGAS